MGFWTEQLSNMKEGGHERELKSRAKQKHSLGKSHHDPHRYSLGYILPCRSRIEALHTLNSPPVVSFNIGLLHTTAAPLQPTEPRELGSSVLDSALNMWVVL